MGSNIEPARNLVAAMSLLAVRVSIVATSQVFETVPVGIGTQAAFLNAAIEIRCDLEPGTLKHQVLRPLEEELGRVRSDDRNAPRTIDLDISYFGQRVVRDTDSGLEIPDPETLSQAHVAIPLADLAPGFIHPVAGVTLERIAASLDASGVRPRAELALWPQSGRF